MRPVEPETNTAFNRQLTSRRLAANIPPLLCVATVNKGMTRTSVRKFFLFAIGLALTLSATSAARSEPKYSANVPSYITTPDTVGTLIDNLKLP